MKKGIYRNRNDTCVLFSIHERPAEMILSGQKRVEYRVVPPKLEPPYIAIFYVSERCQKIKFAAIVQKIFRMPAEQLLQAAEKFNAPGTHDRQRLLGYLSRARSPAGLLLDSIHRTQELSIAELREIEPAFRVPENFVYASQGSKLVERLGPYLVELHKKLPAGEQQQLSL